MKTVMFAGGAAVVLAAMWTSVAAAQQPPQRPNRQVDGGLGGGNNQGLAGPAGPANRSATRRVQGGPGGEPQLNQQSGQYNSQRTTVREGIRQMPSRPAARWRLGVDTQNAPKGLYIADIAHQSPAQQFGLETGDYLLDVMGYPVGFYENGYYPLGDALNQFVRPDGWVNLLVWNHRTNGEEAIWIRLQPRGGGQIPFGTTGAPNN